MPGLCNPSRRIIPALLPGLFALLLLLPCPAFAQVYVRAAAGYGLAAGSDLIETNDPDTTPFSDAWEGIYSSYGKGFTVEATIGCTVYAGVQLEAGVSYLWSADYSANHSTDPLSRVRHEAHMLSFEPAVRLGFDAGTVFPFVRFGGIIASPFRKTSTTFSAMSENDYTSEDSGNLAYGFFGGIGCAIPLSERLSFTSEVDLTEINWGPEELKLTSGGSSQSVPYGDIISQDQNARFRPAIPFGQIGMKVGVQYAF